MSAGQRRMLGWMLSPLTLAVTANRCIGNAMALNGKVKPRLSFILGVSVKGAPRGFWAKADVMEAYQRYREQEPQASIVGVGHSMGAAAVALAQLSVPGMFRSMVLFEPIIQPLPFKVPMSLLQKSALHTQTKRRRPFYPSIEDARSSLEGKPLFRSWHPEAFNAYIAHGNVADGPCLSTPAEL